jgi:site-specific recombinase XerD
LPKIEKNTSNNENKAIFGHEERISMEKIITEQLLLKYKEYLIEEEKSQVTISKYMCDLRKLMDFADGREIDKQIMIEYKEKLLGKDHYKISSINSFLVAANKFLEYMGWYDARVKTYKVQRECFCPDSRFLSREEYVRLVETARGKNKKRLAMIIQTICATGIRISELKYLTVANVKNNTIVINCKGKIRKIILPDKLKRILLYYIYKEKILKGAIFRTSSGKSVNRSNIWREMKLLCSEANVSEEKVFPHNLRHLFAYTFYQENKDIGQLADILGHSSIETTRIYIRTTQAEHLRMLNRMKLIW